MSAGLRRDQVLAFRAAGQGWAGAAAGARALIEAAGLAYVDQPYVAGAVRARG